MLITFPNISEIRIDFRFQIGTVSLSGNVFRRFCSMKSPTLRILVGGLVAAASLGTTVRAHVGEHPSVHDTVAAVALRLREKLKEEELKKLTPYQVYKNLTERERTILGNEHITFKVNVPVKVSILRDRSIKSEPFWMRDRDFALSGLIMKLGPTEFDVWEKEFQAGPIGLGVNSFGRGRHYLVTLAPLNEGDRIQVTSMYPATLRLGEFKKDAKPYVDTDDKLPQVPEELENQLMIRTEAESRNDARLVDYFRWTDHVSTPQPDQVLLTWSGDPQTTQTVQWRTNPEVKTGALLYQKKALYNRFQPQSLVRVEAVTHSLETPDIINDQVINLHVVQLNGLEPGATYIYSIGDGSDEGWTELAEFTTAPDAVKPFSFIYMGDAQNGLYRWGSLLKTAARQRPDAAFYVMAGDLVDRGNDRDDWDAFYYNCAGVYNGKQLVPAIGNHENQGGHPTMYLELMNLLENGPDDVEKERAYSFEYSNALFVILDSNLDPRHQTAWLDRTLGESKATWKFAVYHHPAYSSAPARDNADIRKLWGDIFDKHHLDMALQGHDHAYLRTFPMKGGKRVSSAKDGTIYIVSVSGTKMYKQNKRDYTEFGMTNTPTFQVLDLMIDGNRLVYRAYDIDGKLRDDFTIEK